jgi:hypothetical protein
VLKKYDQVPGGPSQPVEPTEGTRRTEAIEILAGAMVSLLVAGPPGAHRPGAGRLSAQHPKEGPKPPKTIRKTARVNLIRSPRHAVMSPTDGPPEARRQGGTTVGKPTQAQRRDDRETTARVAGQLAALATMTTAELAARFAELTGQTSRTRNRAYLRKRVAWHLQAAEYGGLSQVALARIDELAPLAMKRFAAARRRRDRPEADTKKKGTETGAGRDPRLPDPGAVIRRVYGGDIHEVTVLNDGFEYRGRNFRSLSKIAREITGTPWNGFTFFGCGTRNVAATEGAA